MKALALRVVVVSNQIGEVYLKLFSVGNRTNPTTPSYVDAKPQSTDGSANIQALRVGNFVFFIQRGGTILRTMVYDYRNENYPTYDLSKKAEHLLEPGVKAMAYTTRPDSILYLIMNDGSLVTVTMRTTLDSPIYAFQKWSTSGCFDDIGVISGTDRDEVWVSVKRLVNGVEVYYIEQFQTARWEDSISITVPDTVLPVVFDPPGGTYYSGKMITMSCGTFGAKIYYTTNGTIPTENSLRYTSPIWLDTTTTLKARAFI